MATKEDVAPANLDKMSANLARVEELSKRLIEALSARKPANATLNGPSQELFLKASQSYMNEVMQNPGRIFEHQVEYWGKSVKHFMDAQVALAQGKLSAPPDDTPSDRRFSNPLWATNPYFNYVKQQYMLNAEALRTAAVPVVRDLPEGPWRGWGWNR